jgi:hypothetical protein
MANENKVAAQAPITGFLITGSFSIPLGPLQYIGVSVTITSDGGFFVGAGPGWSAVPVSFAAGLTTNNPPSEFANQASWMVGAIIVGGNTLLPSGTGFIGIGSPQFGVSYGVPLHGDTPLPLGYTDLGQAIRLTTDPQTGKNQISIQTDLGKFIQVDSATDFNGNTFSINPAGQVTQTAPGAPVGTGLTIQNGLLYSPVVSFNYFVGPAGLASPNNFVTQESEALSTPLQNNPNNSSALADFNLLTQNPNQPIQGLTAPTVFNPFDAFQALTPNLAVTTAQNFIAPQESGTLLSQYGSIPYADATRAADKFFANVPSSDVPFPSWAGSGGALGPTNPLVANGIIPGYSSINGALLNTQSGQLAFGTAYGPSDTTTNWPSYSINNVNSTPTIDANALNGLNQTADLSSYSTAVDYLNSPDLGQPVVLDLTGNGINITQLSSSSQFHDMTGDGYQNRTAWAGAGNGVLAIDLKGTGVIDTPDEFEFTDWDPTATSDMQALRDVFDTDHDGKLDAGDTDWNEFGVLVTNADGTTTFETLSQLGITSINLTTDNNSDMLADGSEILGETTYTTASGGTGTAADASFAYDSNGYATQQTVTRNADGSTTIDVKAFNPDGSLANETFTTTSADGLTRTLQFDHAGNGIIDQTQTGVTVVNPDGSRTETLSNFDASVALGKRTVTTTSGMAQRFRSRATMTATALLIRPSCTSPIQTAARPSRSPISTATARCATAPSPPPARMA